MSMKDIVVGTRAWREVQHLGVQRPRQARDHHPRPPGPDGRDDADERRIDTALDRLPCRADHPQRRLPRRRCPASPSPSGSVRANQASSCTAPARSRCSRTSRTDVPARSSSTARGAADARSRVRARRERVVPEAGRIDEPAELDMAKTRAMADELDDIQRLRRPVRNPPAHGRPGETTRFYIVAAGPTLRDGRRISSARSSTMHRANAAMTNAGPRERRPDVERTTAWRRLRREDRRRSLCPFVGHASRTSISGRSGCSRSATHRARCPTRSLDESAPGAADGGSRSVCGREQLAVRGGPEARPDLGDARPKVCSTIHAHRIAG